MKIGDEVEILISSSDFYLYAGSIATVVDIITDKNDKPVLATIHIDNDQIDKWNKGLGFHDDGLRNICLDHIRLPK
jgi:hypothetical protein